MTVPLAGMKILDFTYLLPGPFGTMMLADLGADIIKVENKLSPDMLRYMPPFVDGVSAAYAHINRGKKSLALDLKAPGATDVVRRLVRDYDIVLEQFRPGVMDRLGLGYSQLRDINPRVIYCSLTGYGQTGAFADRAGHDINYMALSGIESFSGRREGGPALTGIQIADLSGGSKNLVIAMLAAHIKRLGTGEGDFVDVSIIDGMFSMTAFFASGFLAGGTEPAAEREALNGGAIYDFYRTGDGRYLSVGPIEPKFLNAFAEGIGYADLAADLISSPGSHAAIKNRVAGIVASKPLAYWIERFNGLDACVEPVRTLGEAASSPPISDRGMIVTVPSHTGNPLRQISSPFVFSGTRHCAGAAGAPLGHDTEGILSETGYGPDDIARLKDSGAV